MQFLGRAAVCALDLMPGRGSGAVPSARDVVELHLYISQLPHHQAQLNSDRAPVSEAVIAVRIPVCIPRDMARVIGL